MGFHAVALGIIVAVIVSAKAKILSIERSEVDTDANSIKFATKLHPVDGMNVVDIDIEVLKDDLDVSYGVVLYHFIVDHFEHYIISEIEGGCTHDDAIKDPVLNFIIKESTKYGNLTACPLKIGHYQMRNFKIDTTDMSHELSHELPAGSYRFEFTAYIKHEGTFWDTYTAKYYFTIA